MKFNAIIFNVCTFFLILFQKKTLILKPCTESFKINLFRAFNMKYFRSEADTDTVVHPGSPKSTLGTFLTLLWTYIDQDEMNKFLRRFIMFLASVYKETPIDLEYERQRMVIVVLSCICNHQKTRKYLLEYIFFKKNW